MLKYNFDLKDEVEKRKKTIFSLIFQANFSLKKSFHKDKKNCDFKKNYEIVTQEDKLLNEEIESFIKEYFPLDGIISEESSEIKGSNDFVWFLDPIDGTANYCYDIPLFGTSLSLVYGNELVLSFLTNPIKERVYVATFNENAMFQNQDEPQALCLNQRCHESFILSGSVFNQRKIDFLNLILEDWSQLALSAVTYRNMGCTALEILLNALRYNMVFFTLKVRLFDILAALHLVKNMEFDFLLGKNREFLIIYPRNLENKAVDVFIHKLKNTWSHFDLNSFEI